MTRQRRARTRGATARRVLAGGLRGFWRDNCLDLAAALTFWSLLAVFPALIVVVALVGLIASSEAAVETIGGVVSGLAPADVATALESRVREITERRTAAGVLFSFGLLGALWTSSAYLRSFTRAANAVYGTAETRPAHRLLPRQLGLTVGGLILVAVVVSGLAASGPVARALGAAIGLERPAVTVWDIAKWPVLVLIAGALLSLLFWLAPDVRPLPLRPLTVGGAVTLVVWAASTTGLGVYVANFDTYDVTYGALGAAIVGLVWLFLTNAALLLGVEINAQLRGRDRPG